MNTSNASYLLNSLETGLRSDSSHLIGLGRDLSSMLNRSRKIGAEFGSPGDWISRCQRQLENTENILHRFCERVHVLHEAISSSRYDRLENAWEACETIQSEEASLKGDLRTLQTVAIQRSEAAMNDWNMLSLVIEFHLENIHACTQAIQIKLELLRDNSRDQRGGRPSENGVAKTAAAQTERKQLLTPRLMDKKTSMFMWIGTPMMQAHKTRYFAVRLA